MPFSYIYDTIDRNMCIGNALSTINANFTALDVSLSSLSAYTVASINYLSATMESVSAILDNRIQFLSATMESVSAALYTDIQYVSSNVVTDYIAQGDIFQEPNGIITWDTTTQGKNAKLVLSANGFLSNPSGLIAGQTGNLVVQIGGTSGFSITGLGADWKFSGSPTGLSATMSVAASAYNLISFYYEGTKILANVVPF